MSNPISTDQLRSSFLQYFRGSEHKIVEAASLIPSHSAAPLFTNAGMVAFLPYFFAEEDPSYPRLTSVQKCVRVRGKHDDIEAIGRTTRHLTFFEMLGNFSFGDYFKEGAIRLAWNFLTEVVHLPPDRLWATVHVSDDDAAGLWRDIAGLPDARIQKLEEDNFWEMGATGPCGPSSEIFYDKGAEAGAEGGPAFGGEERYVEIWNLVFMQYNRLGDGSLQPLPKQNIDTGAGLERILPILQGASTVFETDVLRSLIGTAEELSGCAYGKDTEKDVSLRILADHARAVTFLLADGVVPSNEERGYVLRRIIRRAALHARRAGAARVVLPDMAAAVTKAMQNGYPGLAASLDRVQAALEREEHRFADTLSVGLSTLDSSVPGDATEIPGELAFKLHDTYGLPIELTRELAAERGLRVDEAGFQAAMEHQRALARASAKSGAGDGEEAARDIAARFEPPVFVGYEALECTATVRAVVPGGQPQHVELYTDVTPFYAEGGGQIGDTGHAEGEHARGKVVGTDAPLPGMIRHHIEVESGRFEPGQSVRLTVDASRRAALRRSHTGTHLLHWALRSVLGPSAQQQGSLVAPDYLRFDFSHHSALTEEQLHQVEALVAGQVRGNTAVEVHETSLAEAKAAGALSFFGERYSERVRVVHAGGHSVELCGGTHVSALGDIGEFMIRSESSIGANLRRIEALVGAAAFEAGYQERTTVRALARTLRSAPESLLDAVDRIQEQQRSMERERRELLRKIDEQFASDLGDSAQNGVVVARCDRRNQADLKRLASLAVVRPGVRAVGLVGSPDGTSVAIAVAIGRDAQRDAQRGADAPAVARQAAAVTGGGGGGKDPHLAVAGGRKTEAIDAAMDVLRSALGCSS